MNLCFIIGKIITELEFKFMCNKKIISIAYCSILLSNKSIIKVFGYNEVADYLYSKVKINDETLIKGILVEDTIEIKEIKILNKGICKYQCMNF